MATHNFNFEGGEILTGIGATWFVSYAYYENIDKKHRNWAKVSTYASRYARYTRSRQHHKAWLKEVLAMNPANLNKNTIDLDAAQTQAMASELLSVLEQSGKQTTGPKALAALDKKVDAAIESLGKNAEQFTNTLEDKIDSISEADIERFFCKIGKGIATFFTVILPKFINKAAAFFIAIWKKVNKIIESNGWGFLAPFLFLLIVLIVIVLITTGIRGVFS